MMNILIDLRPLMAGNTSGVEVYMRNLLEKIFKNDSKNHYILWWNSHHDVSKNIPRFKNKNITYLSTKIPNKILNLSLSLLRYPKIDKWIGGKAGMKIDRVFVPDPRPAPVSKECKKVITIHDLSFEHFKHTFSWKTKLWHKLLRPRKEVRESAKVIAVSKATKEDVVETYGASEEKVKVIYEASGLEFTHLAREERAEVCGLSRSPLPTSPYKGETYNEIRKKYNLPERFILTLSTIEPRKNIEGLLEAFQKLKKETDLPHKLIIAGRRNERIFAKVKNLKVDKNVIFTGFVSEENKAKLYALADAFVYPSFFEGFGLPLVEAMQMGCPALTSDISAMPEIVREAGQLVNPYEIESIKNGMKLVLEDENLRKQMKAKSLARAGEFSWEKCAKETLNVITNC